MCFVFDKSIASCLTGVLLNMYGRIRKRPVLENVKSDIGYRHGRHSRSDLKSRSDAIEVFHRGACVLPCARMSGVEIIQSRVIVITCLSAVYAVLWSCA